MPQIHQREELDVLYGKSVDVFFDAVRAASGDKVVVAFPGGRSIVPFLNGLVSHAESLSLDNWHKLEFFMVDERAVDISDDQSNFRIIERHLSQLADELIIRKRQFHPYIHDDEDPKGATTKYLDELNEHGGVFDIVCLGIGEDGHVAGLFPGHESIRADAHEYIYFEDSPKPPPKRVSASKKLVQGAGTALLFAVGEGKLEASKQMLDTSGSIEDCPARMIHSIKNSHVFTNLLIS